MKKIIFFQCLMFSVLFLCTSCHTYHFGVPGKAAMEPDEFAQTEAVIAHAEQSEGAKYCPDKIAKAKELARQGVETYWACHNTESSNLLAEARKLAKEAEECGPKPVAAAPAPAPAPAAPTCDLSASPTTVNSGQSTVLTWSSQNSKECNIQPGIGPVKPQGSITVTPQEDTAYTLTCSGEGGSSASSETKVMVVSAPQPTKEELCMTLNIEFATNKSEIRPAYFKEVEKVANFMKRFPQIKGTLEGHTDNVGNAKYNLKLSQRRADSVMKMLVQKYGIDKSRLAAKGYGLTKPIADNKTVEGRQKNRRTVANFGCVTVEK